MESSRVHDVLMQFAERSTDREHKLMRYSMTRKVESHDEADAESPIVDSFYNSGRSEAVVKMINFPPTEFRKLYDILHGIIVANWNSGRGRKVTFKPIDVLFMTLVVMKHKTSWDHHANCFSIDPTTLMLLITGFVD